MYKNILLPTDGSELSEKAIREGINLAKAVNAKVTGLYVIPKPSPGDIWDVWTPEDTEEAARFRAKFEESLKCVAGRYLAVIKHSAEDAGIPCECVFVTGESAAEEILKTAEAKGCDLIFMASHSRSGLRGTLLGSVTTKVLSHSPIPVSVYRKHSY